MYGALFLPSPPEGLTTCRRSRSKLKKVCELPNIKNIFDALLVILTISEALYLLYDIAAGVLISLQNRKNGRSGSARRTRLGAINEDRQWHTLEIHPYIQQT